MPNPIAWGILGCARIARRGLIPGIRDSQTGRLQAIASRDGEKVRAWAAEFDIPRAYGDYDELLRDRDIQAVYIPLPNELHKPWTLKAAEAGKHVLCDKPLALSAAQAEEMVDACRRQGVLLMEGFMWRHHPRTTQVLELIRQDAIGAVRLVRCSFSFSVDHKDWRLDPARGGGALWDIGCYGLNTCRLVCGGEPQRVAAVARWGPTGVDMTNAVALRFAGDVLAQIDCSFEQPYRCSFEMIGTTGVLEVPQAYLPGDAPQIVLRRGEEIETITVPALNQYAQMVDHFGRAVLAGQALSPPAEDGLANMRLLDRVLAAARAAQDGVGGAP
jgi:predicted dehydrogenase